MANNPVTRRVALLSLPRDTIDVPLPGGGTYPDKINGLWSSAAGAKLTGDAAARGYNALMGALGTLYRLDIQYYVELDFTGFREVVDTLGGVTVDVQSPVLDSPCPRRSGAATRNPARTSSGTRNRKTCRWSPMPCDSTISGPSPVTS